jgi:HK97 family phage major capsid protein
MRKSIRDLILAEANASKAIVDLAEKEERDLTEAELTEIDTRMQKAAEHKSAAEREEQFRAQMTDLSQGLGLGESKEQLDVRREAKTLVERISIGERFATSPEYKALLATVPAGIFGEKARVTSSPMVVPGGMKNLLTGANGASAGALVEPQRLGFLDPYYQRPLAVRDLFTQGTTSTDTIEYVQIDTVTNNAKPVAEAVSSGPIGDGTLGTVTPVEGGVKPESGMTFKRDTTNVKTIAHWLPITKRALADAAQIRTIIDNFLRYGLEEELEDQLVTGDGTGENFLGIVNQPGIQTQGVSGDAFDTTRKARTKVSIGARAVPTAYLMNPMDWQDVELMRNAVSGDFFSNGPFSMMTPHLWGLPVVLSEAIPAKQAWVAAWNYGVIWDREQSSIQATDSHSDFFIRNLVALLSELRAAFALLRPPAFVKITLP